MSQPGVKKIGDTGWGLPLLAALAGLIVFSLLIDPSIINPFHVGWLAKGDPAASYMGWMFFRQEHWSLPLGLAHRLGMEQASSIVYSDSIPLLAIVFKLFSAWLPAHFQYDGLWLFSCYALQGYFACRLLMLFSRRGAVLIAGVVLFLLSPIMLLRAQAHFALTAHWIIVAALYLYYAPTERRRLRQWLLLLWLAPWMHAYLMFMAYAVWAAYLLRYGWLSRRWTVSRTLTLIVVSVVGSLSMMWLAGYFCDMEVSAGGFGFYSMNLLSPFMPVGVGPFLMPSVWAATGGQYEGFNYLGLGVLLALVVAVANAIFRSQHASPASSPLATWREQPDLALILCCLGLSLLAVSNVVTFGAHRWLTLPLPPLAASALNIFRASGRLFWPVNYLLLLAAMRGASRLSRPLCSRLLFVVLVLQIVDLWPYLHSVRRASADDYSQNHFPTFASPFWKEASRHYQNIYVIPGIYQGDRSIAYQSLAGAYGFAIDSAYYARMPSPAHLQSRRRRHGLFFQGVLDPHGIYLVQRTAWKKFSSVQRLLPANTGVGQVDGFTVVAPNGLAWNSAGYLHAPSHKDYPPLALGASVHFGKNDAGMAYALGGWSEPGDGAVWSVGKQAILAFHVTVSSGDVRAMMEVMPYLPAAYPRLGVTVTMNGHPLAHWLFERGKPAPDTTLVLPVVALSADAGNVALGFTFDKPRSPRQSGESADPRELALLLRGMKLEPN